jgi:hypothetical protein
LLRQHVVFDVSLLLLGVEVGQVILRALVDRKVFSSKLKFLQDFRPACRSKLFSPRICDDLKAKNRIKVDLFLVVIYPKGKIEANASICLVQIAAKHICWFKLVFELSHLVVCASKLSHYEELIE